MLAFIYTLPLPGQMGEAWEYSRKPCYELFRVLGYYATWGCLKPTFREYLWVPTSRVKLWPLKIRRIGSPETSVSNRLTTRNNSDDGGIQFYAGGSLRSRKPGCIGQCSDYSRGWRPTCRSLISCRGVQIDPGTYPHSHPHSVLFCGCLEGFISGAKRQGLKLTTLMEKCCHLVFKE